MITIAEVIEECAKVAADAEAELWRTYKEGNRIEWGGRSGPYIEGGADTAGELAEAIRALAKKYEGCIVAEGEAAARLSRIVNGTLLDETYPLYRAREVKP